MAEHLCSFESASKARRPVRAGAFQSQDASTRPMPSSVRLCHDGRANEGHEWQQAKCSAHSAKGTRTVPTRDSVTSTCLQSAYGSSCSQHFVHPCARATIRITSQRTGPSVIEFDSVKLQPHNEGPGAGFAVIIPGPLPFQSGIQRSLSAPSH